MAQISKCLKLISRLDERDQDALVARLDELQAQGVPAARAQIQAAIDVLTAVQREDAPVTRSASRAPAGVEIVEVEDGFDAMKDGKRIGRLRDNLPRGAAEQLDENASVDIVKVDPEFKGQGVGSALYEAFNEKHGGRIAPSGKTSPEAWALWKRKYPEKVDAFVEAEAGRIRDGADQSMVIRNISDPEVARRVAEAAPESVLRSAARQTETPEFKAWFGDSKVVDADGRPLVVYHGTKAPPQKFDAKRAGAASTFLGDYEVERHGIFAAEDPALAEEYANQGENPTSQAVMPLYMAIESPLDTVDGRYTDAIWNDIEKAAEEMGAESGYRTARFIGDLWGRGELWKLFDADEANDPAWNIELLRKAGFDGMRIYERSEGDVENTAAWVAFDPTQVKSASGNSGTFDPADADITRSATRPQLFSQLQRSIEAVPDRLATMAAPQWKLWLDANAPKLGVKKDEIEWSGVKDYLDLRGKDKVGRDELVAYLADSGVRVEETVLGSTGLRDTGEMYVAEANDYGDEWAVFTEDGSIIGGTYESQGAAEQAMDQMNTEGKPTKYGTYTVPGGENYREVLITLPSVEDRVGSARPNPEAFRQQREFIATQSGQPIEAVDDYIEYIEKNKTLLAAGEAINRDGRSDLRAVNQFFGMMRLSKETKDRPDYKSSHWDQPNILAHLRVDDRTDAEGNKVLFINEIQSDWGQGGKKNGFLPRDPAAMRKTVTDKTELARQLREQAAGIARDMRARTAAFRRENPEAEQITDELLAQSRVDGDKIRDLGNQADAATEEARRLSAELTETNRGKVPHAPFIGDTKAWASLALKRAIMMAVEGGYDRVALITGAQAADLYDLRKQIDRIDYNRNEDGTYSLSAIKDGSEVFMREDVPADGLEEIVGKDVAKKIVDGAGEPAGKVDRWEAEDAEPIEMKSLSGLNLASGGEGMQAFYDQIIPQVARDVLKKLGGGSLTTVDLAEERFSGGISGVDVMKSLGIAPSKYSEYWANLESDERDRLIEEERARLSQAKMQPGFDITPAMREKVASGVPLFSKGRTASGADWDSPSASKFDELVYKFQDKQIDTKRVVEAIKEASGSLRDDLNVYLNEELYHGRAAKRTEDFVNMELNPLIEDMAKAGMTIADLEEFLHARHAKEANAVIAQRNPGEPSLQDGGSGMTNAEADNYMATLPADDRKKLQAAADKVDAIISGTREMFVDYELESRATVDGWNGLFKHYVPLQREDKEGSPGLGQGFSIKGKETKGRTGSTRKVVDILANIAMQRERAIVRGEKNRVAQSLVGLVRANENPDFWLVDEVPTERVFNPATGLVEDRVDPMYKSRDNAVVAKIKDPSGAVREHAVLFNEEDPRALRMAQALKNLDAQELNGLLGASAKVTRYFAAVNTQYNPVFGVVNLVRDVQGAMLNLSSTPLKDDKAKIAKYTASALAGIYGDMRAARKGKSPASKWAALWDEFQEVGGQTGYRDLFATSADRARAIQHALDPNAWMDSKLGKVFTAGGALKVPLAQAQKNAGFLFDWLSDYNGAMENGVRLAAYKAGLERGMTKQQAASAAKNLTTNFNRKGQVAQQAGAMYAFFNAAIQGTARIGQTLFDMEPGKPKTLRLSASGKKIVTGGIILGSVQALALAAAGFNEEDPPEFARERNLIIPTGDKTYVSIPMPLGMHIIPNIGRVATEFVLSGFRDPIKRSVGMAAMFADAFNPIGNAGMSMQTLAPTALDPLVALTENKDWTGKPIAKTSFNKATPGHALGRDTSTAIGEVLSEAINTLSGGNKYVAGVFSPTPDQIDYLLGQLTGGVGREYSKTEQTLKSAVRGEALPTYKIPLVGRFVGNAKGQASEGSAFYSNVDKLNELETEAKGLREDGKTQEAKELLASRPEAYLITAANYAERQAQKLRREKSELIKAGAPREQVKALEEQITAVMARLNRQMEELQSRRATAQ